MHRENKGFLQGWRTWGLFHLNQGPYHILSVLLLFLILRLTWSAIKTSMLPLLLVLLPKWIPPVWSAHFLFQRFLTLSVWSALTWLSLMMILLPNSHLHAIVAASLWVLALHTFPPLWNSSISWTPLVCQTKTAFEFPCPPPTSAWISGGLCWVVILMSCQSWRLSNLAGIWVLLGSLGQRMQNATIPALLITLLTLQSTLRRSWPMAVWLVPSLIHHSESLALLWVQSPNQAAHLRGLLLTAPSMVGESTLGSQSSFIVAVPLKSLCLVPLTLLSLSGESGTGIQKGGTNFIKC